MIYPILCRVEFEVLHRVFAQKQVWKQLGFSVIVNWVICPFIMVSTLGINEKKKKLTNSGIQLGLAWAFLPDKPELREGLILVGLARCIAMVLIWNGLSGGDDQYCAILVSVNSILQMILFAPYAIFILKTISKSQNEVTLSYSQIAKSVGVFLGIPLGGGIITRFGLRPLLGPRRYDDVLMKWMGSLSLIGLLFTILILFASQGKRVVQQIVSVLRVAAPMVCYFILVFFATLAITLKLGFGYELSITQSFTASSNNFELAIAIAVATFGHDSNQALAATVGPLIEVPVLLAFVYIVNFIHGRINHNK